MTTTGSMSPPETVVDLDAVATSTSTRRRVSASATASRHVPDSGSESEASSPAAPRLASPSGSAVVAATFSPASDPSLLLAHLDSPQAVHLAEAANLARPILKYLATPPNHRLAPFDRAWLVALHREIFGDVWAWAGRVRDHAIDRALAPGEIDAALAAMLADRAAAIANSVPPIERSATLLARASSIRPFLHGNGRWARLLVDIDLALFRAPTIGWPNDPAARPILREALAASRRGDLGPITALLRRWQRD